MRAYWRYGWNTGKFLYRLSAFQRGIGLGRHGGILQDFRAYYLLKVSQGDIPSR